MSYHKVPPFDLLAHQQEPFDGFGDVLSNTDELEKRLISLAKQAQVKIAKTFEYELLVIGDNSNMLESIITEMWVNGWNPEESDFNLFSTDFGLVLTKTILDIFKGNLIFRSEGDLSHFSIWWPEKQVEVFPFHKVQKRLYEQNGESLDYFIKGLHAIFKG